MSVDEEPARSLLKAMSAEIAEIYSGLDLNGPEMPKAGSAELDPPAGTFLVGFGPGGQPVCCGGLKDLGNGSCEIKRMFVVKEAREGGVARALLEALEDAARRLGFERARLDTGPRQPRALDLYRRSGYAEIENFNGNPIATFFGEKNLASG
jgi:GNAT superfamily N-acetyltransferase